MIADLENLEIGLPLQPAADLSKVLLKQLPNLRLGTGFGWRSTSNQHLVLGGDNLVQMPGHEDHLVEKIRRQFRQ